MFMFVIFQNLQVHSDDNVVDGCMFCTLILCVSSAWVTSQVGFLHVEVFTFRKGKNFWFHWLCEKKMVLWFVVSYRKLSFHSLFYLVDLIGQSTVIIGTVASTVAPLSTASANRKRCVHVSRNAIDVAEEVQELITRWKLIKSSSIASKNGFPLWFSQIVLNADQIFLFQLPLPLIQLEKLQLWYISEPDITVPNDSLMYHISAIYIRLEQQASLTWTKSPSSFHFKYRGHSQGKYFCAKPKISASSMSVLSELSRYNAFEFMNSALAPNKAMKLSGLKWN